MAGGAPRNFHVLFVHGVGTHSKLSSLFQAYQSLRANTRSSEVAIDYEDLNPEWRLQLFDDSADPPYLKLYVPGAPAGTPNAVYLYEVNYSALAGVVRTNHPLDLTELFVGFDLAVNAARDRLKKSTIKAAPAGGYDPDHAALARTLQRLAGVLVAATVPILGAPSLVLRRWTENLVAIFTRFFEDVATFALDRTGEQLISAHFDRTVEAIMQSSRFERADGNHAPDVLVIAAHSLGTVVTHSYVVRTLAEGREPPSRVLTFGSPIGLVCWLWLFLDFLGMDIERRYTGEGHASYFSWGVLRSEQPVPSSPILWINVVNQLDPIATAFPVDYVDLAHPPERNARLLAGGRIHHRFTRIGSTASAHTSYFDDRAGFLELVSRVAGLRAGAPEEVMNLRSSSQQWEETIDRLRRLRLQCWLGGVVAIALYIAAIAWASATPLLLWLVIAFACPPITIGTLAFCQRFICSTPTKRNSSKAIKSLPWLDFWSFPHRLRQQFRGDITEEEEAARVLGPRPGLAWKAWMWFVSFLPSLFGMLLPLIVLGSIDSWETPWRLVVEYWKWTLAALVVFPVYVVAFAVSEFLAHWRTAMISATNPTVQ